MSMVTYIFYSVHNNNVPANSSLIKKKIENLSDRKKDKPVGEIVHKTIVIQINYVTAKTTTLRTLYSHVILNGAIFPHILYIVLYS